MRPEGRRLSTTNLWKKLYKSCIKRSSDLTPYRVYHYVNILLEYVDENVFARQMIKVQKTLLIVEKSKYLEPFFSRTIEPLIDYLRSHYVSE